MYVKVFHYEQQARKLYLKYYKFIRLEKSKLIAGQLEGVERWIEEISGECCQHAAEEDHPA